MSDIPSEAPDLNRYNNMGLSTPAEAVLNTIGGVAYDFTTNACRFFIAQSDGNVTFTSHKGSSATTSVLANIKYPIRVATIDVSTSADLLCCW
jgi:hypothetical protein